MGRMRRLGVYGLVSVTYFGVCVAGGAFPTLILLENFRTTYGNSVAIESASELVQEMENYSVVTRAFTWPSKRIIELYIDELKKNNLDPKEEPPVSKSLDNLV